MSKNAQTDYLQEWANLLRAARKNKADLAGITPYLDVLERAHGDVMAHRGRCDALRAASQEATLQLQKALAEGRDAASRVRSFIKSVLGNHSEQLVRYGIAPIPKRRPRGRDRKAPGLEIAN